MNERQDIRDVVDEKLDARLLAVSKCLNGSGYMEEVIDLYIRYRDDRWRLLVEYLELMRINGFPEEEVMFYQTL